MTLPEIKFTKKVPRTIRRVAGDELDDDDVANDKVARRMFTLQEDIQTLREEYDFICGQKGVLNKKLDALKIEYNELMVMDSTGSELEQKWNNLEEQKKQVEKKTTHAKQYNKNLKQVILMCERHPPENAALIEEVERKIKQDEFLIREIKSRLWEQRFEKQSHIASFRKMKQLVQQGVNMHDELLKYRIKMKIHLQKVAVEDQKLLQTRLQKRTNSVGLIKNDVMPGSIAEDETVEEMVQESKESKWQNTWQMISMRTGIIDPEIFFRRLTNGTALVDQINSLKKSSEARVNALKLEAADMEVELEEVRYEASFAGGQSRDTYQRQGDLASAQQKLRRVKERTESAEQLQNRVTAGLNHISELLGIPLRGEESSVVEIIHDIETSLETLVEEKDKNNTSTESPGGFSQRFNRESTVSISDAAHHPAELDAFISKLESTKSRIVAKLPSKVVDTAPPEKDSEEDDIDNEGMWDRKYAKAQAQKCFRSEQKKAARQSKLDSKTSTI